jgi:hypothetical protein
VTAISDVPRFVTRLTSRLVNLSLVPAVWRDVQQMEHVLGRYTVVSHLTQTNAPATSPKSAG